MGFLGFANVYAMRVNLSIAIVAMVNNTAAPHENYTIHKRMPRTVINSSVVHEGEFDWDEATQGVILGSFFYGYVLTQIPGGRLAEVFGGKLIYGLGVFITALFTLLTPVAARINYWLLLVVRILEGVGEGVTFPAMHAMLAKWIPPLERSKFAAYVYAGTHFGTIVSLPLTGWLCTLQTYGGWPLAFYVFGILGIIWFMVWLYLVFDSPVAHPRITAEERNYILAAVGPQDQDDYGDGVPWRSILSCLPLYAILITQCGQAWAFYTNLTELPTYMQNILHFNIEQNAVMMCLPYMSAWICGVVFSTLASWILSKGYLSQVNSMKIFNSLASVVPSLGLLAIAWAGAQPTVVLTLLALTGGFTGAQYAGNQMNHIALAPKYAGTMYGITNAISNTCGFLAPYAIGLLINGDESITQWRIVFYLAACINMTCNLFYICFASADEQSWSRNPISRLR
uniref:Putative permease of the major facilitator superfamily protein n=1 Tax=Xenopsylla cheopis TaxID=163159 RepID=A0A6M2DW71_XENCH